MSCSLTSLELRRQCPRTCVMSIRNAARALAAHRGRSEFSQTVLVRFRAMPETVLLVDDDAPILRMLERTLAAEGYAGSAVADGGSALAHVEQTMPDAIVLDVAMPGLDGLAVTRRLREKGLAVPILLLTARD